MDRFPLNKTTLLAERRKVAAYRAFLPALEVKRRSLLLAHAAETAAMAALADRVDQLAQRAGEVIPMLADNRIKVEHLLSVERVATSTSNVCGVRLPQLGPIVFRDAIIGRFTHPHWVEAAVALAREAVKSEIARRIAKQRVELLATAMARATQRVNLLERVLLPKSESRIHRIEIQLADLQRAEVIAAKLSKARSVRTP